MTFIAHSRSASLRLQGGEIAQSRIVEDTVLLRTSDNFPHLEENTVPRALECLRRRRRGNTVGCSGRIGDFCTKTEKKADVQGEC